MSILFKNLLKNIFQIQIFIVPLNSIPCVHWDLLGFHEYDHSKYGRHHHHFLQLRYDHNHSSSLHRLYLLDYSAH